MNILDKILKNTIKTERYILEGEFYIKGNVDYVIMCLVCNSENEAKELMKERINCYKNMRIYKE